MSSNNNKQTEHKAYKFNDTNLKSFNFSNGCLFSNKLLVPGSFFIRKSFDLTSSLDRRLNYKQYFGKIGCIKALDPRRRKLNVQRESIYDKQQPDENNKNKIKEARLNKTRKDLKEMRSIIIDGVRLTENQNEINESFFNTPSNDNQRIEMAKTCIIANKCIIDKYTNKSADTNSRNSAIYDFRLLSRINYSPQLFSGKPRKIKI